MSLQLVDSLDSNTNMLKKILLAIIASSLAFSLVSCSGNGSTPNPAAAQNLKIYENSNEAAFPITINAFASILIPYGQSTITTNTWVHNNTTEQIIGITYSAFFNGVDVTDSVIDKNSAQGSSVIAPSGETDLLFHTPIGCANGGGVTITAHYTLDKTPMSYSSTFTCENISDEISRGVIFGNYSPITYNTDSQKLYVTLYALGSGNDVIYDNLKAITSPGVEIVNNNFAQNGMTFASNEVQAIELSVDPKLANANLILKSAAGSKVFMSQANIGVVQQNAPILFALNNILFDSAQTNEETINITNPGVESVSVSAVTSSNSHLNVENGCNIVLPGGTCSVKVQLNGPQSESDLQSSLITMSYSGIQTGTTNTSVVNVQWFNKTGFQPLTIRANNAIGAFATLSFNESVTISNPGGYPIQLPSTLPSVTDLSGNSSVVSVTLSYGGAAPGGACMASQNLAGGQSCSLQLTFVGSKVTSGSLLLNIPFSLGGASYNRYYLVSYSVAPYAPLITADPSSINKVADTLGNISQSIILTNSGPVTGTFRVSTPSWGGIGQTYTNSCNIGVGSIAIASTSPWDSAAIPSASSCTITYKYNLSFLTAPSTWTKNLQIDYYGGSLQSTAPSSIIIPMTLMRNNSATVAVSASGNLSGLGTSASRFVFSGASTTSKTVTFTITNTSGDTESIVYVNNSNTATQWSFTNNGINPCVASTSLATGQSCTLRFTNVMSSTNLGSATSFNSSVVMPSMNLNVNGLIVGIGVSATAYTTMNQAVVTPQTAIISLSGITLPMLITNESAYPVGSINILGSFSFPTSPQNLITGYTVNQGLCNVTGIGTIGQTQLCAFPSTSGLSSESASVFYLLDVPSLVFSYNFTETVKNDNTTNLVAGVSPSSVPVNVNMSPVYLYIPSTDVYSQLNQTFYQLVRQGGSTSSSPESFVGVVSYAQAGLSNEYNVLGCYVNQNYLYVIVGPTTAYYSPVTSGGAILIYNLNTTTGVPTYMGLVNTPSGVSAWHPADVSFATTGGNTYLYVADDYNKTVWQYQQQVDGSLVSTDQSTAFTSYPYGPKSITSESGYVYVLLESANKAAPVCRYAVGALGILTTPSCTNLPLQPLSSNYYHYLRVYNGLFYGSYYEASGSVHNETSYFIPPGWPTLVKQSVTIYGYILGYDRGVGYSDGFAGNVNGVVGAGANAGFWYPMPPSSFAATSGTRSFPSSYTGDYLLGPIGVFHN